MANIVEHSPSFDPKTFIGKEINNITLLELIGRGAMGAVYVGYQKSLKRKVALKVFPKEALSGAHYQIHFREEAEIVAVLHHPNIVTVFDMGETDDFLYISMQLIPGEDLRSMIYRQRLHPIPAKKLIEPKTVLSIVIPVLDALAYAHEEGVIHQDIKPGNILIEERTQRSYLADFGIARSAMNEDTASIVIMGTPLYIAPEQVNEQPADAQSDIYSAGVVLYEALAGKLPFQKTTVEALLELKANNPDELFSIPPSEFCKSIDTDLEKIILKAVATDRNERFQTCRGFYTSLKTYYNNRFGRDTYER
jgi:eukaryotic-like serine/threonine-protein kinase